MSIRPETALDFYKTGHGPQYPKGTTQVYSNFTPRSSAHFGTHPLFDEKVVNFGWQKFIVEFLIEGWSRDFFRRSRAAVVGRYKRRMDKALGEDTVTTGHIEALYDLGYLPLEIKTLPEGARVSMKVPLMTIKATKPEFFWLVNYLETAISAEMWKPITVATIAYEYHKQLKHWAINTGSSQDFIPWQNHDFSFRGMSGVADAAICGAAHLLSSYGTDTVPALDVIDEYYLGADSLTIAGSVPATEHSVMCMGGKDDEVGTFKRLITELYPNGIVSIVSDTWDFWNVIGNTAPKLHDYIMEREGKVVFRPDSGDPVKILTGYKWVPISSHDALESREFCIDLHSKGIEAVKIGENYRTVHYGYNAHTDDSDTIELGSLITEREAKGAVEILWEIFGGTTNARGFRTLDSHVGLIYGDSITLKRHWDILSRLAEKGFAADNVVFGIGSYTYQYITRDTFGMAMKATYGEVNGEAREIFKDPITDSGVKKSARGLLRVDKGDNGDYLLSDRQDWEQESGGELTTIFCDGMLVKQESFNAIRARLGAVA